MPQSTDESTRRELYAMRASNQKQAFKMALEAIGQVAEPLPEVQHWTPLEAEVTLHGFTRTQLKIVKRACVLRPANHLDGEFIRKDNGDLILHLGTEVD